ncbi:ihog [Drosophila busckii]|uniref:Interference hedgehog n=1 Tax=Drosophila busckii TaxID=30019 RepID=A0A0M4E0I5_DROBS|nr:interference hedgehog [Drosophila busckii]ALC38641.1 ihog [Drosophila busckii]
MRQMKMLLLLLLLASTLTSVLCAMPGVRILRDPVSQVAEINDKVSLECETSLPPERFEWSFAETRRKIKYLKTNITNDNVLSTLSLTVSESTLGDYRCVAWFGPLAVTSTTAQVQLTRFKRLHDAEEYLSWRVPAGNSISWSCAHLLLAEPAANWRFYKDNVEIKYGQEEILMLEALQLEHSGNYSCLAVHQSTGKQLSLASLQLKVVQQQAEPRQPPHLLLGQKMQQLVNVKVGQSVNLSCEGIGNPAPRITWRHLDVQQSKPQLYIAAVQPELAGNYSCELNNGIRPALEHLLQLQVLEAPRIIVGPQASLTNEGADLQLQCQAQGKPTPEIYWLLNGEKSAYDTAATQLPNGDLLLQSVQKRHAGYVQCFARNALGETRAGTLLQVNPEQKQEEATSSSKPPPHKPRRRQMVPPSAPNVTRLSDESVMLRWLVPSNDGLPIQFFKVQYRQLGEHAKRRSWQTTNDNIPFGKQQRSEALQHNFTTSVTGLRANCSYRFRIMAVYSNNDNKESATSGKFYLQRGESLKPLAVPELADIEAYGQSAVLLHWRLAAISDEQLISGYYAYYRPASSAGEYLKITIDGSAARSFLINALEPGTVYEFKLQSFSPDAASEFSALKQGRTQRPQVAFTTTPAPSSTDNSNYSSNDTFQLSPLLSIGSIGGAAALLLLLASFCLCRCRRRTQQDQEQQQHKTRLAELREDFLPLSGNQKARTRHIHITLNPLEQQKQQQQQQDVDSLSYSPLRRSQRNNNNLQAPDSPGARVLLKRSRLSSRGSENLSTGSLNSIGV